MVVLDHRHGLSRFIVRVIDDHRHAVAVAEDVFRGPPAAFVGDDFVEVGAWHGAHDDGLEHTDGADALL